MVVRGGIRWVQGGGRSGGAAREKVGGVRWSGSTVKVVQMVVVVVML